MSGEEPPPQGNLLGQLIVADEAEKTDFEKIFRQLLDPENIRHNTELNMNEVTAFSVLTGLGIKYDLTPLNDVIRYALEYRVSKGRKGRGEIVKIVGAQAQMPPTIPGQEPRSGMSRWFRRR